MPEIRTGNLLSDLANGLSGIRKGKQEADDNEEAKALKRRMAALEEQKEADAVNESNTRHLDEVTRLNEMKRGNDLNQSQFEHATGEERRKLEERHLREGGLRSRLQQLSGKTPVQGLEGMGLEDLDREIQTRMQENARVHEIDESRKYDLDRMALMAHRKVEAANTRLLSIRRNLDSTLATVQSNPILSKLYAANMKAGLPINDIVKQAANGVDLMREYDQAAMQVLAAKDDLFQVSGSQSSHSQSPLAEKATNDALPFKFQSPEVQMQISAEYANKIRNGQPIDTKSVLISGIPVDAIAKNIGGAVDMSTGKTVAPTSSSSAGTSPAPPTGAPLQINQPGTQPPNAASGLEQMMKSFTSGQMPQQNSEVVTDPMSGAVVHSNAPAVPAPTGPTMQTGQDAVNILNPVNKQYDSAGGVFQRPAAPAAPMASPAPSAAPAPTFTPAPATPAPSGDTTTGGEQPGRIQQLLRQSRSLPEAEQFGRALLDMGQDYNTVISSAPQSFQSMLAAKLPKRIPTKSVPLPVNPLLAPPSLSGNNPFQAAKPLFSPPGT